MGREKETCFIPWQSGIESKDFLIVNLEICIILGIIQTQTMLFYLSFIMCLFFCNVCVCMCVCVCVCVCVYLFDITLVYHPSTMSSHCGSGQAPIFPWIRRKYMLQICPIMTRYCFHHSNWFSEGLKQIKAS